MDWVRRRIGNSALVIVAIGKNSIAYTKHPDLTPRDAVELLESNLPAIHAGFAKKKKGNE